VLGQQRQRGVRRVDPLVLERDRDHFALLEDTQQRGLRPERQTDLLSAAPPAGPGAGLEGRQASSRAVSVVLLAGGESWPW